MSDEVKAAAHTPGPWMFVPDEGIPGHREPARVQIGGKEYFVGGTANARLIAAAPDMLEALRAVIDDVSSIDNDSALSLDVGRMVKAAIAKAEGNP